MLNSYLFIRYAEIEPDNTHSDKCPAVGVWVTHTITLYTVIPRCRGLEIWVYTQWDLGIDIEAGQVRAGEC